MKKSAFKKILARLSKHVLVGSLALGSAIGFTGDVFAQSNSQFQGNSQSETANAQSFPTPSLQNQSFQTPNNSANFNRGGYVAPQENRTNQQTPQINPIQQQANRATLTNNPTAQTSPSQNAASNQNAAPNQNVARVFRAYQLDRSISTAVSKQIQNQLGGLVEVVEDTTNNRLLVNTTERNHRLVKELIQNLDSPQRQTQPASQIKSIRAFNVSTDRIRQAADQLSRLYVKTDRIIVAADETVGKLMVFSTEQDYEEIATYLKQNGFFNAGKSDEDLKPGVRNHKLQHVGWRELEQSIYRGWGNRIKIEVSTDGAYSRIQIPTLDQRRSMIQIDRANNLVQIEGSGQQLTAIAELIALLDQPLGKEKVSIIKSRPDAIDQVQTTVSMYKFAALQQDGQPRSISTVLGKPKIKNGVYAIYQDQQPTQDENQTNQPQIEDGMGPIGRVEIITIPGTDIIILKGDPDDVARVRKLIEQIEKTSEEYKPQIEVMPLKHVDNIAVQVIAAEVYTNFYQPSLGDTSITALVKPNALLLVGTPQGVKQARELVEKLDVEVEPMTEFKAFRVKHMSAVDLENRLRAFYLGQSTQGFGANQGGGGQGTTAQGFAGEGLAARLRLTSDYRSNTLFIHASPRDMAEITKFVSEIDVQSPVDGPVNELKIIRLKNSTAAELAPVLQDILTGQLQGAGQSTTGNNQFNQQFNNLNNQQFSQVRSVMLALQSLDPTGKIVQSSILFDTRITADENSNSLVINAPKDSLPLIELLVKQLDQLPDVESRIKVFELENASAPQIVETVQNLFETQQGGGGGGAGGAGGTNIVPLETGGYQSTIVSLRLAADARSNTIIAAGSQGDLNIIEALVTRLDEDIESDYVHRVYRLQNVTADVVQEALNGWLTGRSDILSTDPRVVGTGDGSLEAVKRAISVQAETETNSLIVSAHKEYIHIIENIIRDIDFKKQVVIQAVIAEITLGDTFEFGIEWGVQDSLIFNRGLSQTADVASIGFDFIQSAIGNEVSAGSPGLASREQFVGQVLSSLNVGRSGEDYGGLVVSAGNESVNVLLRALDARSKLDVLSRPQITTMENIQAFVQRGQDLPYVTGALDAVGNQSTTFTTDFLQLGVTLAVTPRVRPDGEIWMRIDVGNSSQDESQGVIIQQSQNGPVIQPVINTQNLQTDVTARSGQTVVLGGLIETSTQETVRGIPFFSNIPAIGQLFRFESSQNVRKELFIILRPIVIDSEEDRRALLEIESSRLNWCISDVNDIHGPVFEDEVLAGDVDTVYPDRTPTGYHREADAGNRQGPKEVRPGSLTPLNGDFSTNQTSSRFNQAPLPNQNVFGQDYNRPANQPVNGVQPTNFQQPVENKKKKGFFSFGKKK